MFKKGDCIVYGSTGICEVLDVTTMDMEGIPNNKLYYILKPYLKKGSEIFTPVDNKKTVIRDLISVKEAKELLQCIESLDEFKVTNEKFREDCYKQCVRGSDCMEIMKLIKTLHLRKYSRLVQGKNFPSTDERYLKLAEDNLYAELAFVLNKDSKQISDYIEQQIHSCIPV